MLTECDCCGMFFGEVGLRLHRGTTTALPRTTSTLALERRQSSAQLLRASSTVTEDLVAYTVDLAKESIAQGSVPAIPLDSVNALSSSQVSVASNSRDLQQKRRR
jgi:hypothetical protein